MKIIMALMSLTTLMTFTTAARTVMLLATLDSVDDDLVILFAENKAVQHNSAAVEITKGEEITLKDSAKKMAKEMPEKMNTVLLGFQPFYHVNGIYYPLCDITFSQPIRNLKNPTTGDLRITRMSVGAGSVQGGDEVFIFTERVIKGNIKVRFFQENEEEERVWEAFATFSENDVHHQYAIAFK